MWGQLKKATQLLSSPRSVTPPQLCPLYTPVAPSWGLWDQNPHCIPLSRSIAAPGLWIGLLVWGRGRDHFLMLFCDSGRIFISERVHCRPQPRSQQGVEQEGSFKQRQTLLGLVGIPRAPVELQRVLLGWLCCTGKLFRFERCWLNH